jgi:hypothetical protein
LAVSACARAKPGIAASILLEPSDGKGLDLVLRRIGEFGAGDDDRRWTAHHGVCAASIT